jgi:hypothetical protein
MDNWTIDVQYIQSAIFVQVFVGLADERRARGARGPVTIPRRIYFMKMRNEGRKQANLG